MEEPMKAEDRGLSKRTVAFVFFCIGLLFLSALGTIPLLEPDEGRYAEISREMLATGDFVTPHLNGVVYLEKPPLYYWGTAMSLSVFGESEFGVRAFTASVSLCGLLLTYWMGTVLMGRRTGLFAAMVLSTSLYYYLVGRLNTLDMTLAVTLVLATFPAYLYLSGKRAARGWLILSYGAAGLAFMTKGLVGIVFPAAVLLLWLLFTRRFRQILSAFSPTGMVLFLVLTLPWVVFVQRQNPDFLWYFFVREHFLRYTTKVHHHVEPFWFFVPIIISGFFPWISFLPVSVRAAKRAGERLFDRDDRTFLLVWILFILAFFSFSQSKLITYVAPLFPPLAIVFGRSLSVWVDAKDGAVRTWFPLVLTLPVAAAIAVFPAVGFRQMDQMVGPWSVAVPVVFLVLFGAIPLGIRRLGPIRVFAGCFVCAGLTLFSLNHSCNAYLSEYKSSRDLSMVLREELQPEDVVAQYRIFRGGVPFYTHRRTVLVKKVGGLEFGMKRARDREEYFPSKKWFQERWESDRRVFCLVRKMDVGEFFAAFRGSQILASSKADVLVANRAVRID